MRACARPIALLGLIAGVGCRGEDGPATPAPVVAPAPAPEVVADRPCGEAGPTPTSLPPTLARGMVPVGRGVLRAGESRTVGTVQVRHDPSAWIGTMEVGRSGPAVVVEIDRNEANGGPWGAQQGLHAGHAFPLHVGPYRIDVRCSAGTPVESISFEVARDACPAAAMFARPSRPLWMWLSTEAIQQHSQSEGTLLQVQIGAQGPTPRIDVVHSGYREYFTPRPGEPRSVRAGDRLVTIEEVVPGPGTRFEQTWRADGDARVHARVRVEAAPAVVLGEVVAPTSVCGDPSPRRTGLPDALREPPKVTGEQTLAPGQRRTLGPLELEVVTHALPGPSRRPDIVYQTLQVHGSTLPEAVALSSGTAAQYVRDGARMLRLDRGEAGLLRVTDVALACPDTTVMADLRAPVHAWLSTHGRTGWTIGDPAAPALQLRLILDADRPVLSVSAETSYLAREIHPSAVGQAFSFGGSLVEVVDVEVGEGTRDVEGRWLTDAPVPALHVQVRVSPAP